MSLETKLYLKAQTDPNYRTILPRYGEDFKP